MIYRVSILIVNILIYIILLAVYYKPDVVRSIKLRLLAEVDQYKMAKAIENSNIDKILHILISVAKLQTYNQNLLISKISYQDIHNQIIIVANSQDLDTIHQYVASLDQSLTNNAYIALIQTVDNTEQDLLQHYYQEDPNKDIKDFHDQDASLANIASSFDHDFSYTTVIKITI